MIYIYCFLCYKELDKNGCKNNGLYDNLSLLYIEDNKFRKEM